MSCKSLAFLIGMEAGYIGILRIVKIGAAVLGLTIVGLIAYDNWVRADTHYPVPEMKVHF